MQPQHVEAVEQVFAEPALRHRFLEVDVGCGQHADVDPDRLPAADALKRSFLQHPQQIGLCVERQVADLVEEDGSAIGRLEQADAAPGRPGECAALVAEQLGLHEVRRQRTAVDGDEGTAPAWGQVMQGACRQLLAGARFAGHQHRQVDRRELVEVGTDLQQCRTVPDQEVAFRTGWTDRLALHDLLQLADLLQAQWLAQREQAVVGQLEPVVVRAMQCHEREVRMTRKQIAHRRQPRRVGTAQVDQGRDQVATAQPDPGAAGVFDHPYLPACGREHVALVRAPAGPAR